MNTLRQIKEINVDYYNNIQIVDNASTCLETKEFLKTTDVKVIYNTINGTPRISPNKNKHIYDTMPNMFILTDPDLQLNTDIPTNFIDVLLALSLKYKTKKVGFALDISDYNKMYQGDYFFGNTIYDWEKRFWENKQSDSEYELYEAAIDTTFCLINKNNREGMYLRIAGNFTAKHLPWYIDNGVHNVYETYITNLKLTTKISTTSKLINSYTQEKFLRVFKNKELFLIENDAKNINLSFWKKI
jgi:hypothetical protein